MFPQHRLQSGPHPNRSHVSGVGGGRTRRVRRPHLGFCWSIRIRQCTILRQRFCCTSQQSAAFPATQRIPLLCGRFTLRTPSAAWCQLFLPQVDPTAIFPDEPARFNIAPTQSIIAVLREASENPRIAAKLRWGLVPAWADDLSIGNRMINARSETVDSKPSFRNAFARRRCLIPTDGYYEWKKTPDGKQPYLIERTDRGLLAMAGLWEQNHKIAEDGTVIRSCTILTTQANQKTQEVHDRMPVFLSETDHERWLDPGYRNTEMLKSLLVPAEDDLLRLTAVSRHVNNARNEDPKCADPI